MQSDAKLSRDSSSSNLKSNPSSTSLRRNKSHVEVHRRTKSSDKLKRTASNPAVNKVKSTAKSSVHFDLGTDGPEDEWVDASGSASPYLSRRGSMASGQSSAKTGTASANNSRPHTPRDQQSPPHPAPSSQPSSQLSSRPSSDPSPQPSPDQETAHHKEYLTSRLLQRTPSQGAPPQMTRDTVSVSRNRSPDSLGRQSTLSGDGASASNRVASGSVGRDELTSRFVGAASSGRNDATFYHPELPRTSTRTTGEGRRPQSAEGPSKQPKSDQESDRSALAPRSARRTAAPPAGQSRIQQKLNLQRASSVIEPSQAVGGGMGMGMGMGSMGMGGGTVGATPLVGVAGPGYDGTSSRDPRVGKQLERTGMEYLSVRRYQNPVVRSLGRVLRMQEAKKPQRIPPGRNGGLAPMPNGKPHPRPSTGHARNVSMGSVMPGSERRPVTPRAQSIRTLHSAGAGSSYEGDEGRGGANGLSGSSLVGEDDDVAANNLTALLRNLWEKNTDLSASQE